MDPDDRFLPLAAQVRTVVLERIAAEKRPLSICEIKTHLQEHPIWTRLSKKSSEYTRITLISTREGVFAKYREKEARGRKLYWGIPGVDYGSEWILMKPDECIPCKRRRQSTSIKESSPAVIAPKPEVQRFVFDDAALFWCWDRDAMYHLDPNTIDDFW